MEILFFFLKDTFIFFPPKLLMLPIDFQLMTFPYASLRRERQLAWRMLRQLGDLIHLSTAKYIYLQTLVPRQSVFSAITSNRLSVLLYISSFLWHYISYILSTFQMPLQKLYSLCITDFTLTTKFLRKSNIVQYISCLSGWSLFKNSHSIRWLCSSDTYIHILDFAMWLSLKNGITARMTHATP